MALRLNGQTTGYTELNAPDNGDSVILTMPGNDGTSGQYLQTNGSGTLSWQTVTDTNTNLTAETAQATTSGSSVVLTGIPSDAKRVVVAWNNVSLSGTNDVQFRIGPSTGVATSGYEAVDGRIYAGGSSGTNVTKNTGFFRFQWGAADSSHSGHMIISHITGNTYTVTATDFLNQTSATYYAVLWAGGRVTLSDVLERVEIKASGSNTFDSGNIRLFYEV